MATACTVSSDEDKAAAGDTTIATTPLPAAVTPAPIDSAAIADSIIASKMRLEVDLSARRLRVIRGTDSTGTYRIAVGSDRWPTQTGEWKIIQVVWNPEWIPPDESWAEEREPRKPGDPRNPLGRVQLVYDPPRSIHGTNDRSSIGKAVSHGSIRMYNEDAAKLGRELMEVAGVRKDESFYRNAEQNRSEKIVVDLPGGVPIRIF